MSRTRHSAPTRDLTVVVVQWWRENCCLDANSGKYCSSHCEVVWSVVDTCPRLVSTTMRSVLIDSTYEMRMALDAFCEFALYWLVSFGVSFRSVLYYLILYQSCTALSLLFSTRHVRSKLYNFVMAVGFFLNSRTCVDSWVCLGFPPLGVQYVHLLWRICPKWVPRMPPAVLR